MENDNKVLEQENSETSERTNFEQIIVCTKFDYKTMKYCNKYIIYYKNKAYLFSLILGIVVIALGAYMIISSILGGENVLLGVIVAAMGLFMGYSAFNLESKIDAQLVSYFNSNPVREQIAVIDDEKITIAHKGDLQNGISYDWAYVTQIDAIPEYYMLFVNKKTPLIIDRSEEALEQGTKEQLDNLILDKASLKPYKEIFKNIVKKPITYVHSFVEATEDAEDVENEVVENSSSNAIEVENEVVEDSNTIEVVTDSSEENKEDK